MWTEKNNQLYKKFTFQDFKQAFAFMTEVARLAEEQQHHPEWKNVYNVVEFWLQTHDEQAVTEKDKQLSKSIDKLAEGSQAKDSNQDRHYKKLTLYADGGSRGNPGPSATGYVLIDPTDDQIVQQSGGYLGITTNNQAEYQAVKLGLEQAVQLGAREVDVYLDSLLVVNQMNGIFKVKNRDLWPIHEAIKLLCEQLQKVTFTHVPRELNKLADAEVNKVLDAQKEAK